MAKNIYINKCPEPLKSVLLARNPATLEDIGVILHETDYLHFGQNKFRGKPNSENLNRNLNHNSGTPVNYTMNPQWLNQQPQYQMGNNNSRLSNNSQTNNNPSRNRGSSSRNYHNQPVDHSLPTDRSMNTVNSNNTSLHIHDDNQDFHLPASDCQKQFYPFLN